MFKHKHYKPLFIKEAITHLNEPCCCLGTVTVLRDAADHNRPLVVTLDDGTGCLPAVYFGADFESRVAMRESLEVGADVVVYGCVRVYRQDLQVVCDRMRLVQDPDVQAVWINQVLRSKVDEKKRKDAEQ